MDAIRTLIDQILNLIKKLGSDNANIAKVTEALKEMFAGLFNRA